MGGPPWSGRGYDSEWRAHLGHFAVGRDWNSWENVTREAELLPAPDADLLGEPLSIFDREAFEAFWQRVEANYAPLPFVEAVVHALVAGGELWKHCLRGDMMILKLSYSSFVWQQRRRGSCARASSRRLAHQASTRGRRLENGSGRDLSEVETCQPKWLSNFRFRNATRLILRHLPAAAEPIGFFYPGTASQVAPFARWWYHAAPQGLARLWSYLHLPGSHTAVNAIYNASQLVSFRHDFAAPDATGACEALRLISALPSPLAALQLDSVSPAHLFTSCKNALPHPGLPYVDANVSAPRYWSDMGRHRGEWFPV